MGDWISFCYVKKKHYYRPPRTSICWERDFKETFSTSTTVSINGAFTPIAGECSKFIPNSQRERFEAETLGDCRSRCLQISTCIGFEDVQIEQDWENIDEFDSYDIHDTCWIYSTNMTYTEDFATTATIQAAAASTSTITSTSTTALLVAVVIFLKTSKFLGWLQ